QPALRSVLRRPCWLLHSSTRTSLQRELVRTLLPRWTLCLMATMGPRCRRARVYDHLHATGATRARSRGTEAIRLSENINSSLTAGDAMANNEPGQAPPNHAPQVYKTYSTWRRRAQRSSGALCAESQSLSATHVGDELRHGAPHPRRGSRAQADR